MDTKGSKTKHFICAEACKLFAQKGYKDVTMKDICDRTGLSRGGLYRHYGSTAEIFSEITEEFLNHQQNEFADKIRNHVPASEILEDILNRYETEMIDSEASLSVAIYEFFSDPLRSKTDNSIRKQYLRSREMWTELIAYGIETKEFKQTDPAAVYDLIVFSYQGVRMYSKLMEIEKEIPKRIMRQIRQLLLA